VHLHEGVNKKREVVRKRNHLALHNRAGAKLGELCGGVIDIF
jgi:hypothetical protein